VLASKKPTILVVDDNKAVRELIRTHLETEGYDVFVADGGKAAMAIVSVPEIMVDILVTDILMPHMNGKDLANRICSIKPSIKVLFVSAYTGEILSAHNLCPDGADYIKKPFTKEILLEKVSRVWASGPRWKELVSRRA
jgi:two-component system, cell cycle sensor histidine kinase and response regulator CckA